MPKPQHQPNPNPHVEAIVQAYLKTYLSDAQFEELVVKAIKDAEDRGAQNAGGGNYDKGFSDGYDSCEAEYGLGKHQEPQAGVI